MHRFLAIVLMLAAFGAAAAPADYPRAQLPDTVRPLRYTLELTILPEREQFSGKVAIDVTLKEPTRAIWMHAQDQTILAVSVMDGKAQQYEAKLELIPDSGGVAQLTTATPIPAGPAKITIVYAAPFNRQLEGLYRTDEDGNSYAFSQMEPIFARLAFPSFDEPRFKTPYDMTLIVNENHVAVTNTPVEREEKLGNGLKRLSFARSKPLPTYLIAFAVGPLDVVEWKPIRKTAIRDVEIPLRGIAAKGKGKQFTYALENTEKLLLALEDYFGTPYPYEKLDLIAAVDFSAGAMENAGAIVYREPLMLLDENAPLSQKRLYVLVHAHEMSHQWFGNLVTPVWWNDIWLNEAFATWMEYRTARAFDPAGEYDRLVLTGALDAMGSDSWRSARQIAQPVNNNDDISNAFDSITYDKGGGVLQMFERFYGEENFRKGVQLHMKRFAWGNATSKDFMQSIADASKDARGVAAFESFLNQAGVPFLQASLRCTKDGAEVSLTQSRYSARVEEPRMDQKWQIPVCVAAGGQGMDRVSACTVMTERRTRIPIKANACPSWVMPNADGAGYVRFALDKKGWQALFNGAAQLNASERLAAIDSLDAGFTSGVIEIDTFAEGLQALVAGDSALAWDVAGSPMARLGWIADTLVRDDRRAAVTRYIDEIYGPIYKRVGISGSNDAVTTTLLRTPLVGLMALDVQRADVRADLAARGAAYLGIGGTGQITPEAIDPNLTDTALAVAVQDRGAPVVNAIFTLLKTERNAVVRSRLIRALSRSRDPAIAARVRALAFSPELRVNEVPIVVSGAVSEEANVDAGWAWFKANFDAIAERTPPNDRGGLAEIGMRFCSRAQRDDFRRFFNGRIEALTGGPRTMAQVLEQIDACRMLVDKQRRKAEKFFTMRGGSDS